MASHVIETQRLLLRRLEPGDAEALHAIMSDADAMQYWSTLPHSELAQTEEWIAKAINAVDAGESDDFAVLQDGVLVGKAGLWKGDELGMIFAKSTWGTGVATEAVRTVIDRAKANGIKRITADVDPRNDRALKFLTRLGFAITGSAERTYKIGDVWTDSVYLELDLVKT